MKVRRGDQSALVASRAGRTGGVAVAAIGAVIALLLGFAAGMPVGVSPSLAADDRESEAAVAEGSQTAVAAAEKASLPFLSAEMSVYIAEADGSALRKLVQIAGRRWHGTPMFSPDDTKVSFHAYPDGWRGFDSHVFVINSDGTGLKDLGLGCMATWKPDGSRLVFYISDGHLDNESPNVWEMDADGDNRRKLFPGMAPSYSPDGGRIVYSRTVDGKQSLYVYDVAAETHEEVLREPYRRQHASTRWSPDGKHLAYIDYTQRGYSLTVIDAAGSEKGKRILAQGDIGWHVGWAPANKILYWARQRGDERRVQRIMMIDPSGDAAAVAAPFQNAGVFNYDPSWSHDGKRFAFSSDR